MSLITNMDSIYATRVLRILVQPFNKQPAFKMGLIDENGNQLRKPINASEIAAYDPLHTVLFSIKKVINRLPGGDFRLKQLALVLQLIRQRIIPKQYQDGISEEYAVDYLKRLHFITESKLTLVEEELFVTNFIESLFEEGEAPTTNTSGIAPVGEPVIDPKKKKPVTIQRPTPLTEGYSSLYVSRPVDNADEIVAWAKEAGFEQVLAPSDLHVTICYSKSPVGNIQPNENMLGVPINDAELVQFDGGANVLKFKSAVLTDRHNQFKKAGASADYEYQPHITISYSKPNVPLSEIKPFSGSISFGPEQFEPINENWKSEIKEE